SPSATIFSGRLAAAAGERTQPSTTRTAARCWTEPHRFPYERWCETRGPMMTVSQAPAISLAGVNLSLGQGAARVHILKDISLHIGTGQAVGLVGPSGSGKSTLLMVMAGLERADSGTVTVMDHDLRRLDEDALARFRGRQV